MNTTNNNINLTNEEMTILLDALIYASTKMLRDNYSSAEEIAEVKALRKAIQKQVAAA
jgi:hypothetical protein